MSWLIAVVSASLAAYETCDAPFRPACYLSVFIIHLFKSTVFLNRFNIFISGHIVKMSPHVR